MNAIPGWQGNLREHLSFRPLPLEVAKKMHIEDLRADFWSACNRLHVGIGTSYLPADFPNVGTDEASVLEREEILRALQRHAYWFDPNGGHPAPNKPAYYVFKMWWEWPLGFVPDDVPWAIAMEAREFDQAIAEAETLWRSKPHGDAPDGYVVGTPIGYPEFSRYERGRHAGMCQRWKLTDGHPYGVTFDEAAAGLVPRYVVLPRPHAARTNA